MSFYKILYMHKNLELTMTSSVSIESSTCLYTVSGIAVKMKRASLIEWKANTCKKLLFIINQFIFWLFVEFISPGNQKILFSF